MRCGAPRRINVSELVNNTDLVKIESVKNGSSYWVPARGVNHATLIGRIRLAWSVFTGKADALFWEEQ